MDIKEKLQKLNDIKKEKYLKYLWQIIRGI